MSEIIYTISCFFWKNQFLCCWFNLDVSWTLHLQGTSKLDHQQFLCCWSNLDVSWTLHLTWGRNERTRSQFEVHLIGRTTWYCLDVRITIHGQVVKNASNTAWTARCIVFPQPVLSVYSKTASIDLASLNFSEFSADTDSHRSILPWRFSQNTRLSKIFEMTTRRRRSAVPVESTEEENRFPDSPIDASSAANRNPGNPSTGRTRHRSLLALGIRRLWSSVKSVVSHVASHVGSRVSRTPRTTYTACATLVRTGLKMVRSVEHIIETEKARLRSVVPFIDEVIDLLLAIYLPLGPAIGLCVYRVLYAIVMPLEEDDVQGMSGLERRNYRQRQIICRLGELMLTTSFPPCVSIMFAVFALFKRLLAWLVTSENVLHHFVFTWISSDFVIIRWIQSFTTSVLLD